MSAPDKNTSKINALARNLGRRLRGTSENEHLSKFIILISGRCGSSYLTELLDSHPSVVARGEPFGYEDRTASLSKVRKRLTRLFHARYPRDVRAVGFKSKLRGNVTPVYEDIPGVARLLTAEFGLNRCLLLMRRNTVKQAISRIRTQALKELSLAKTGQKSWNVRSETEKVPASEIEPEELDLWIRKYEAENAELEDFAERLGIDVLTAHYEDLLVDESAFMTEILGYLDVPSASMNSTMIKHTSDDLSSTVSNFEHLLRIYKGTPYEPMLLEGSADR